MTNSNPPPPVDDPLVPDGKPVFVDVENAFMLYATFCGDVNRTAHALSLTPGQVYDLAQAEHWDEKIKPILELKKSARPGDIERAVNRAINFVQAARFRHIVERAVALLHRMADGDFIDATFSFAKGANGRKVLAAKGLADLATAMEKAQALTYMALTDTASDRAKAAEEKTSNPEDFHLRIAKAMSKVDGTNSVSSELFEQQLAQARELLKDADARDVGGANLGRQ